MRARRYAVKRYLSAYFEAAYILHYNKTPPDPWIVEHGGHKSEHIQPNPFVPLPKIK